MNERQINVSYIGDPQVQAGCGLGQSVRTFDTQNTVHLPFAQFSALLTHKLLCQLEVMEADTVVEASAQNVTCFFWPGERMNQQAVAPPVNY